MRRHFTSVSNPKTSVSARRGFTLIELLVVILIISVLAAMIVPKLIGRTSEAKQVKALADLEALNKVLAAYRLDVGNYPTSDEGLAALDEPPGDAEGWKGPYTQKAIPLDPWGNEYVYEWPGSTGDESYLLMSLGRDGAEGGEGEDEDIIGSE